MSEQPTMGQAIRTQREGLDISLRELARKTGLSPSFISDIELGRRYPSDKNLQKIAHVLKYNADEFKHLDTRQFKGYTKGWNEAIEVYREKIEKLHNCHIMEDSGCVRQKQAIGIAKELTK